jgi:hypothetical protein
MAGWWQSSPGEWDSVTDGPVRLGKLPGEPGIKVFEMDNFSVCPPCLAL